jgi:hypothetical protein
VVDLFAEWTDAYQTPEGKKAIMAGDVVFDCYYCQGPLQLVLPLAIVDPQKPSCKLAKRKKSRCEEWLKTQHPGESLSNVVERAGWKFNGQWAFDGYNWEEGQVHRHGA